MTGRKRSSGGAIGILFERDCLYGCYATPALFRATQYNQARVQVVPGQVETVIELLLFKMGVGKNPLPIVAALPTQDCLFATRRLPDKSVQASPRTLLKDALSQSGVLGHGDLRLDGFAVDVLHFEIGQQAYASAAAAFAAQVDEIRGAVGATQHLLHGISPAAYALIQSASQNSRRAEANELVTRVFLGDCMLLAAICRGSRPILWHTMSIQLGDEETGITSAVDHIESEFEAAGFEHPPESVVIHGRQELRSLVDNQWLEDNLPGGLCWESSHDLSGSMIARSLADSYFLRKHEGFDLARKHRASVALGDVVPVNKLVTGATAACALAATMIAGWPTDETPNQPSPNFQVSHVGFDRSVESVVEDSPTIVDEPPQEILIAEAKEPEPSAERNAVVEKPIKPAKPIDPANAFVIFELSDSEPVEPSKELDRNVETEPKILEDSTSTDVELASDESTLPAEVETIKVSVEESVEVELPEINDTEVDTTGMIAELQNANDMPEIVPEPPAETEPVSRAAIDEIAVVETTVKQKPPITVNLAPQPTPAPAPAPEPQPVPAPEPAIQAMPSHVVASRPATKQSESHIASKLVLSGIAKTGKLSWAIINGKPRNVGDELSIDGESLSVKSIQNGYVIIGNDRGNFEIYRKRFGES